MVGRGRKLRGVTILLSYAFLASACQRQTLSGSRAILAEKVDTRTDLAAMERRAEQLVNEARQADGLSPLAHSDVLAEIAREHSRDMARHNYLGHEDRRGHGPDWRVRQRGIGYHRLAENVAENQGWEDPVGRAVDGWLQSSGHRRNIMDRALTQAGVGITLDAESATYYFTQLFLQPASDSRRRSR